MNSNLNLSTVIQDCIAWCMKVVWLSAGVSSFIAGYLAENVDKYIYIDIKDQHPDSMRFIKDCEKVLDHEIEILKSDEFEDVAAVVRKFRFINSPHGAACTGMLERLGIKRPVMYDLGYSNNNCIGCVKGGMGYWNKIRVDFPEVFEARAKLEREIGHSCLKECFLDELDPNKGKNNVVVADCGIMCELGNNGKAQCRAMVCSEIWSGLEGRTVKSIQAEGDALKIWLGDK